MSPYTVAQSDALNDYIAFVLRELELGSWRVKLMDEHPDGGPDVGASIRAIYGRRVAELRLRQGFFDDDLEHIEHYLIHELCHLFSEGIDNVVQNGTETLMGKPAFTIFDEQYRVQMELMTDGLAYVFADLLEGPRYRALAQALKPVFGPPEGERVELPAPTL